MPPEHSRPFHLHTLESVLTAFTAQMDRPLSPSAPWMGRGPGILSLCPAGCALWEVRLGPRPLAVQLSRPLWTLPTGPGAWVAS